jgi:phosphodiesterase/alkaline phosphatase D-like protein
MPCLRSRWRRTKPSTSCCCGARCGRRRGTTSPPSSRPFFNNFETLDSARLERPDFFVYLGDTIYADSGLRPAPAQTLDQYRAAYRVNRDYEALRALMQATATYAIWADHEVQNDFDGQTVDRALYANGREAFLEYMPIHEPRLLQDASCAGTPLFRAFRWGKDLDLIILDERSCRSASVEGICQGDLAPTLPGPVRQQFGLPAQPPVGCLQALFDPTRTLIGPVQKQLLAAL